MNAVVSRPAHTWAATHRMLIALVAAAVAATAVVLIVLMTSSSPSGVLAPAQGRIHTQLPVPTGAQPQGPADPGPRCVQHMGLQYMGVRPC